MLLSHRKCHLPRHLPPRLVSRSCCVWRDGTDPGAISFLVIIPAISQLVVNKSDLVLVNAAVMQPRAESIQLTLESALNLKIALPVRIEPIVLNLFVRDTGPNEPWANVTIAGKTIKGNTTLGVSDVHTPLINTTTWTSYVHNVVFDQFTTLSLRGTTNSYLGVLKSPVVMDKDVVSPSKLTTLLPPLSLETVETATNLEPGF